MTQHLDPGSRRLKEVQQMIYVHHTRFRNQVALSIQIVPTPLCPVLLFSGKLAV